MTKGTHAKFGGKILGTIMAVFAHPDDETFICGGAIAKYAAKGHHTILVCATKGEMGRRMGVPPLATRETIATVREQELKSACEALGIAEVQLLGYRDKSLEIEPLGNLVQKVLSSMQAARPDVVITFHEDFGGHPDHSTIGAAATRAFATYKRDNADAKLYFIAWSNMLDRARDHGLAPEQFVTIDIREHQLEKMRAFRAHKTQTEMNDWLWGDDRSAMRGVGTEEYFIQYDSPYRDGLTSLIG